MFPSGRVLRPLVAVLAAFSFFGFMAPSCQSTVIFRDDFNGSSLDLSKWRPNWLGSSDTAVTPPVNGAEDDCFDPHNVAVGGGQAWLSLYHENCTVGGTTYPYKAGMIQTAADFHFQNDALVEARVYLPGPSSGVVRNWPAFWINGDTWPGPVEADIMEGLSGSACWHTHYSGGSSGNCVSGDWRGWHTYGLFWSSGELHFVYDGTDIATLTTHIPTGPHYIILNYAVDDDPGGSANVGEDTMFVDWVQVTQYT